MFTHTPLYTKVLVTQSCPTPHDAMDSIPPGSSVHGILQARIVESFAISFSRGSSPPRDQIQVSHFAGKLSEPPGNPAHTQTCTQTQMVAQTHIQLIYSHTQITLTNIHTHSHAHLHIYNCAHSLIHAYTFIHFSTHAYTCITL